MVHGQHTLSVSMRSRRQAFIYPAVGYCVPGHHARMRISRRLPARRLPVKPEERSVRMRRVFTMAV